MKKFFSLFLVLLLTACATLSGGNQTFNITGDQIAQKLNEKFAVPVELSKMLNVNLSNSVVTFDEQTGRMTTTMDALLSSNIISKTISGKLGISGKLRFDPATNAVMLDEPKVENVQMGDGKGKINQLLGAMAYIVSDQITQQGLTLYEVKPEELQFAGQQYAPTTMQVVGQDLQVTLVPK